MGSKRSREGELLIDHRASPGLTPAQILPDVPAVPKGELYESAVVVCGHCQCAIILNPQRTRERGWCAKCDKYLCDACTERLHRTLECRDMERVFDQVQNAIEREGTSLIVLR